VNLPRFRGHLEPPPIKHARKVLGTHARYAQFLGYGEAEDYPKKLN
jgi:hypothetical protein